jgi:hypothetical protein
VTVFLKLVYISSFLSVLPFLISFLSPRHQSKRDALSRTKNISANFFFLTQKRRVNRRRTDSDRVIFLFEAGVQTTKNSLFINFHIFLLLLSAVATWKIKQTNLLL